MKILRTQHGLTLMELLAVLLIGAIFSLLAFNILFNLMKTEDKVVTETQLRDTAEYYLASLKRSLYILNEDNVCGELQHSEEPGNTYSYILTGDCSVPASTKVTGFVRNEGSLSLFVNGEEIKGDYKNIVLSNSSYIKKDKNVYNISLTLLYNGKSKTFKAEVHSIPKEF